MPRSESGGVEDAGLQALPVVDRNGAPAPPTLPAVLFAIQCELHEHHPCAQFSTFLLLRLFVQLC